MSTTWWAGIAAVLTGIAGIITAWAAVVRARNDGERACDERLHEARTEAERAHAELHALRMGEGGAAGVLLLVSVALFGACVLFTVLAVADHARGDRGVPGESIVGPPGATGATGAQGPPGRDGRDGATIIGPSGENGAQGNVGAPGASVTGPPGATGAPGVGVPGEPGATGSDGAPGSDGRDGAPGERGPRGLQGVPGPTCPEGFKQQSVSLTIKVLGEPVDVPAVVCVAD